MIFREIKTPSPEIARLKMILEHEKKMSNFYLDIIERYGNIISEKNATIERLTTLASVNKILEKLEK